MKMTPCARSGMILTLLLIGMLTLAFNVRPVKAGMFIYIQADGSVNPASAPIQRVGDVYTFTSDITYPDYNGIVVERSNIIIDGNGYTLQGSGSMVVTYGIYVEEITNVTIRNTNIHAYTSGISLDSCSYITVSENNLIWNNVSGIDLSSCSYITVSENTITRNRNSENYDGYGIYLYTSSNNIISGNNITDNREGIYLESSSDNTISGNNLTGNLYYPGVGIRLHSSSNNILRNNIIDGSRYSFGVTGSTVSHFIQDIDTSNSIRGKPVYYLINQDTLTITSATYLDIGYLALVNSTNIIIDGFELKWNYQGILFAYTTNSTMTNNTIRNNYCGVKLFHSSNITISENTVTDNEYYNVYLHMSDDNTISGNDITNGFIWSGGVDLSDSCHNTISGNNIRGNDEDGIVLYDSSNYNIISGNNITRSNDYGIQIVYSSFNHIIGNNITDNWDGGIRLYESDSNTVSGNDITYNYDGVFVDSSFSNRFYHNRFINNTQHVNSDNSANDWDDGYPSGGNYWSGHTKIDDYQGANQDEPGGDGIADIPYFIDVNNEDRYPLTLTSPYTVHIHAYCLTENEDVNVIVTMDGTIYSTPHTFAGLMGTHTFTISTSDPHGHPFHHWSTGAHHITITVTTGGTYTGYYKIRPTGGGAGGSGGWNSGTKLGLLHK